MAKWNLGNTEEEYTVYMKSSDFERLRGDLGATPGSAPVFFVKGMLTDLVEMKVKAVRRVPSAVPYGEYYDPNV